ncbi:MAG: proteasome accessory factor PafA2 family protein [Armatimonadetes bacterium]|nr:proteasome accessory factor PafA2 family protein [Armatimonadota bacterium]MDE2206659.1 proteasome accessory factor PafA2 family protein [Armatimonadota bacterium]
MRSRGPVRSLIGLESEFFIAPLATNGRATVHHGAGALLRAVRHTVKVVASYDGRLYLPNGGCAYLDIGSHPEYATPECETPDELVRFALAGDLLFLDASQRAVEHSSRLAELRVWRGSVTYSDRLVTCASHENYSVPDMASELWRYFVPFLVTRVIYAGSGGLEPHEGSVRFTLSPRVDRQALGAGPRFAFKCAEGIRGTARLHLACGDALASETSLFLRAAATALVVAAFEVNPKCVPHIELANNYDAMCVVAADASCKAELPLSDGGTDTAIGIQWRYLEYVSAACKTGRMPAWADDAVNLWARILTDLEEDIERLDFVLDWRIRLRTFNADQRLAAALAGACSDVETVRRLRHLDRRFLWLGEGGVFSDMDAAGVLRHAIPGLRPSWADGVLSSPATSRARFRSAFVTQTRKAARHRVCDWSLLRCKALGAISEIQLDQMYTDEYMPWQLNRLEEIGIIEPPPSVVHACQQSAA